MVSMKDIAGRCGVSVATVSKALNGHQDIGEETRRRITAMAEELGYMANSAARALKTNRTSASSLWTRSTAAWRTSISPRCSTACA